MKCVNCGTELMEGEIFCPECGAKNEPVAEAPQSAPQPAPQPLPQPGGTKFCPQCGNQVDANAEFCAVCGYSFMNSAAPTPQPGPQQGGTKFCPQCGNQVDANAEFCGVCGFSFTNGTPAPKQKPGAKKIAIIAVAAVAVVAVIGVAAKFVVPKIFSSSSKSSSGIEKLVYVKDNQLGLLNGSKVVTVSDDLYDDKDDASSGDAGRAIQFSDDGKYIFYPVDYNYYDGFDLYRKKVSSSKDDAEKIDTDVTSYYVVSANKIVYLKDDKLSISTIKDKQKISSNVAGFTVINDNKYIYWASTDGDLYIQDINLKNDKTKVASDISYIKLSEDEKYILWVNSDGDVYVRDTTLKKDKQKLASDISGLIYCSDDFSKIIYRDIDAIYLVKNFGDKQKIDDDISGLYVYTDDDTDNAYLYYTKLDATSYTIADFLTDDIKSSDENDSSYDAQVRNETREYFDTTVEITTSDFYYYDIEKGKSELVTTVNGSQGIDGFKGTLYNPGTTSSDSSSSSDTSANTEYVITISGASTSNKGGMIVARAFDMEEIPNIKYSELYAENNGWYNENEFINRFRNKLVSNIEASDMALMAIYGGSTVELDVDNYDTLSSIYVNLASNMLYLSFYDPDDSDDTREYTIASTNLTKDAGKLTTITDEAEYIVKATESGIYYFTEVSEKSNVGELYINNKKITDEAYKSDLDFYDTDSFFYASDAGDSDVTLVMYNGKKIAKISDEVYDYVRLEDGSVAFLYDYSTKRHEGDLKLYKNGKIKDIDTEVSDIIEY